MQYASLFSTKNSVQFHPAKFRYLQTEKFSDKQARKGFRTIRAHRYFRYVQTFSVIFWNFIRIPWSSNFLIGILVELFL